MSAWECNCRADCKQNVILRAVTSLLPRELVITVRRSPIDDVSRIEVLQPAMSRGSIYELAMYAVYKDIHKRLHADA